MNKWFGDFQVLKNINLDVEKNKKIVVCGPSGSGKSTLIRCINRLEEHQRGNIIVEGTELTNDNRSVEKIRGEVGMVFQQYNLFPHKTALQNVMMAPIKVLKENRADVEKRSNLGFSPILVAAGGGHAEGDAHPRREAAHPAGGHLVHARCAASLLRAGVSASMSSSACETRQVPTARPA